MGRYVVRLLLKGCNHYSVEQKRLVGQNCALMHLYNWTRESLHPFCIIRNAKLCFCLVLAELNKHFLRVQEMGSQNLLKSKWQGSESIYCSAYFALYKSPSWSSQHFTRFSVVISQKSCLNEKVFFVKVWFMCCLWSLNSHVNHSSFWYIRKT